MSEPTDGVPEQAQERGSADLSPAVSPLRAAVEYVQQSSEQDLDELEYRIAERRKRLNKAPKPERTHGLRYKAVRRAQLRERIDMTSAKVGALEEGDTVVALEVAVNEAGIIRVRCESGWASTHSTESLGDQTHVEVLRCLAGGSIARPKTRATSLGVAGLGKAGPGYNTREVWQSRPWE